MIPNVKELRRERDLLEELLQQGRAARRRRGVKASRAELEHRLGFVSEFMDRVDRPDTSAPAIGNVPAGT